jgi:hypothetical protein
MEAKADESSKSASLRLWQVVSQMPEKQYKIKKGDTLKFGRVRFQVVKMKSVKENKGE